MRKVLASLLLFAALLPAQSVCQKFDKQAKTFVDQPCPSAKHPKMDRFWNKVGRDTREVLEVTAVIAVTSGLLYLKASEPSSGGAFAFSPDVRAVTAAHVPQGRPGR